MRQQDWVGQTTTTPFKDLPNMRASTAIRKAELLLTLGGLINKAPPAQNIDTIQKVRQYAESRKVAAKIAANTRSSVFDIERAIARMEPHFRVSA